MFEIISSVIFFWIMVLWCYHKWSNRRIHRFASKLKGPPAYPLIGSLLEFTGNKQRKQKTSTKLMVFNKIWGSSMEIKRLFFSEFLEKCFKTWIKYGSGRSKPFKVWFGPFVAIFINKPEDVQVIIIIILN